MTQRPLTEGRPPPERSLSEWTGESLTYVSPANTLRRFGYMFDGVEIPERSACEERVRRQDGPVASSRRQFDDPADASDHVLAIARNLDIDDVGIARIDQRYVYEPSDLRGHVILLVEDMRFPEFETAPDERCHREVWRAYDAVGDKAVRLASAIRELGYQAQAHTVKQEELALIPHAVSAGLGELGKHGSMIHPRFGPTLRLSAVTTEMVLVSDEPASFGVEEFCTRCRLCVDFCPGDAITHDKVLIRQEERWIVDTELCVPFMASHEACGVCLQVCPYNAKAHGGAFKELFRTTVRSRRPEELKRVLRREMQEPWSLTDP